MPPLSTHRRACIRPSGQMRGPRGTLGGGGSRAARAARLRLPSGAFDGGRGDGPFERRQHRRLELLDPARSRASARPGGSQRRAEPAENEIGATAGAAKQQQQMRARDGVGRASFRVLIFFPSETRPESFRCFRSCPVFTSRLCLIEPASVCRGSNTAGVFRLFFPPSLRSLWRYCCRLRCRRCHLPQKPISRCESLLPAKTPVGVFVTRRR